MKFNNKPNAPHQSVTGLTVWHSRSVALVMTLVISPTNCLRGGHVLVVKRSNAAETEPNRYCLPCGYLDWNEEGHEGIIRETYEETGLYMPSLFEQSKPIFGTFEPPYQPWYINTKADDHLQNVSLHYGACIISDKPLPELNESGSEGEIEKALWLPVEQINTVDFAFNHAKRINLFLKQVCLGRIFVSD